MKLNGAQQEKLAKRGTQNAEAYEAYLKGRFWWNKRNAEGFKKAIEYFQQAIAKDPSYALAYAGLSDTYQKQENNAQVAPQEAYPKAKAAALKAVELDDTLAEGHSSLAYVANVYERDWETAEREYKRAMELDPNYTIAHYFYGYWFLSARGKLDEGLAEQKRAEELDPLSPAIANQVGITLVCARQYDAAIIELRKAIELDSSFVSAYTYLGLAYAFKGQFPEAIAEGEKALEISHGATYQLGRLGSIYAMAGKKAEARKVLDQLAERAKRGYVPAVYRAEIYAALGDKDRAFEWLGKAVDDRSSTVSRLKVFWGYDSLRSDPRFQALLRRIGLEP